MINFYFIEFVFLTLSVIGIVIFLIIHWIKLKQQKVVINFRQIFLDLTPLGGFLAVGFSLGRKIGFIPEDIAFIGSIIGICLTLIFIWFKKEISWIKNRN